MLIYKKCKYIYKECNIYIYTHTHIYIFCNVMLTHTCTLAGAPTRAGVRSSGGQGNGQQVVVQTRLQEARSLRVPGLRHRPGSAAASGKREPGVEGGGPWAAPDSAQLRALRGASQVPPGTAQSPSERG